MKSFITFIAAIAAAVASAYSVAQFPLPEAGELPARNSGGKVVAVQVFAPTNGSVALKSVWSADVYTNATTYAYATNTSWEVAYSNTVLSTVYTNAYSHADFPIEIYSVPLATNVIRNVTVTTNTASVYKETVVTTNSLVTGTASSHVYSGAPASDTFIAPFEKIVFEGTAVGGWLRIVLE